MVGGFAAGVVVLAVAIVVQLHIGAEPEKTRPPVSASAVDKPALSAPPDAGSRPAADPRVDPTPRKPAPIAVAEEVRAKIDGGAGGSVKLADGAEFHLPAGAIQGAPEVRLIRSKPGAEVERLRPLSDLYHAVSAGRPRVRGAYHLSIPLKVPVAPDTPVAVYAVQDGKLLYPVGMIRSEDGRSVRVESPEVMLVDIPPGMRRLRQAGGAPATGNVTATPPIAYAATATAVPAGPSCITGAPGEVHEEPGHCFRIVFKKQAPCALAKKVSSDLQGALEAYNRLYTNSDGTAAMAWLKPDYRMTVELTKLEDAEGEYKFTSWRGYIQVDADKGAARPDGLHDTLYHEFFHAVQDQFFNMYVAGHRGHWWFEATAEWAGLNARSTSFATMALTELGNYKHLLSVPMKESESSDYNPPGRSDLSYGYALLIDYVERRKPGYLAETMRTAGSGSSDLYDSLVRAGHLATNYPLFLQEVFGAEPRLPWVRVSLTLHDNAARLVERPTAAIGDTGQNTRALTGPEPTFTHGTAAAGVKLPPLTTWIYRVSASELSVARSVEINLTHNGAASDKALVAILGPGGTFGPPFVRRIAATGERIKGLGKETRDIRIAVFNDDPENSVDFSLTVTTRRVPDPPERWYRVYFGNTGESLWMGHNHADLLARFKQDDEGRVRVTCDDVHPDVGYQFHVRFSADGRLDPATGRLVLDVTDGEVSIDRWGAQVTQFGRPPRQTVKFRGKLTGWSSQRDWVAPGPKTSPDAAAFQGKCCVLDITDDAGKLRHVEDQVWGLYSSTYTSSPAAAASAASFGGKWQSNLGPVEIIQNGEYVLGFYVIPGGKLGRIVGRITRNRAEVSWWEPDNRKGTAKWTLSPDAKKAEGEYFEPGRIGPAPLWTLTR